MVAFISEGSMFLMFDTGLCRSYIWYPASDATPEKAESCSMGDTAWFAIAAGVLHFWALVCVCLSNPKRRTTTNSADDRGSKNDVPTDENEDETSDDPDLALVDTALDVEEDGGEQKLDKELFAFPELTHYHLAASSFLMQEIIDTNQCDAKELSLVLSPLKNKLTGGSCCSPLSVNGTHDKSPALTPIIPRTSAPDVPMSPVDCIIDATDLSHFDICAPMVWSPSRKTLQYDSATEVDQRDQQQNQDKQPKAEILPSEATDQAEILPAKENTSIPDAGLTFLRLSEGNKNTDAPVKAERQSLTPTQEEEEINQGIVQQACDAEPISAADQF
jgi:hypothetical protein